MVSRRAKHLLLLSRSGPEHEAAINLLEELKHDAVQVQAPACDISKEGILASVLAECANVLPPIKGCIQGTMVLKVSRTIDSHGAGETDRDRMPCLKT